jgi:hypothetical protein
LADLQRVCFFLLAHVECSLVRISLRYSHFRNGRQR